MGNIVSVEAGRTAYLHPSEHACGIVGCNNSTVAMLHVNNTDGSNLDHEPTEQASFNLCFDHLEQLRRELREAAAESLW